MKKVKSRNQASKKSEETVKNSKATKPAGKTVAKDNAKTAKPKQAEQTPEQVTLAAAQYIVAGHSLRQAEAEFNISRATLHQRFRKGMLERLDKKLYDKVIAAFERNNKTKGKAVETKPPTKTKPSTKEDKKTVDKQTKTSDNKTKTTAKKPVAKDSKNVKPKKAKTKK